MYAYSGPLLLHPADQTGTAEDLEWTNAVPVKLPLPKRDGKSEDVLDIDFACYPNRAGITSNPLLVEAGTIGTPAAGG